MSELLDCGDTNIKSNYNGNNLSNDESINHNNITNSISSLYCIKALYLVFCKQ